MKVIFLDHDGVICLAHNWGSRFKKQEKTGFTPGTEAEKFSDDINIKFDNFDRKAIKVLNQILDKTGAEIVVSSDWQGWATVEELGDFYESQGIHKRPIDTTHTEIPLDMEKLKDFPWNKTFDLEQERSLFIQRWIDEHPEITHWVAVDDLNMGIHVESSSYGAHDRDWGLENFVWTPRQNEGIKQSGIKDKIINILNKQD